VERDVFDRFDEEDRNIRELQKLSQRERAERMRELRRKVNKERGRVADEGEVRVGLESSRSPVTEEWGRNKGVRTNLQTGNRHQVKAVGVGDLKTRTLDMKAERLLRSGKPVDVICVDGSSSANKALHHAFKRLPKDHTFILLHGNYTPSSTGLHPDELRETQILESRYLEQCHEHERRCMFLNFNFSSNCDFGEKVCQYERYANVQSIVMGKRSYVSDFRRALLGSSTHAVMASCSMPVTIVTEKEKKK